MVAAGAVVGAAGRDPGGARVPLRPVKGQILRLHDPAGPGLLTRVVRMGPSYLVPRGDGRYVIGATIEERGFDTTVTAGAVFELLRDATELVPGVSELVLDEFAAGLRPGTPDNLPVIGPGARRRPALGGRPLPRRDPAGAGHRRAGRRPALPASRPPDARGGVRARRASRRRRRGARRERRRSTASPASCRPALPSPAWSSCSMSRPGARGVAVALDGEVVPRGAVVDDRRCATGALVEVAGRDSGRMSVTCTPSARDRRPRVALAPDPRHRRLRQPRAAGARAARRPAPSCARSPCAGSDPAARGSILDVLDGAGVEVLPEHRRLLHRPRRGDDRAAGPRGVRDRLDQARGDRRRPHAAARRRRAASPPPRSSSTTASPCCPTRPTTRCWPAAWRTSAAPR